MPGGRQEGFEVSPETKEAIAFYRRGKKWPAHVKKKIAAGVRKGPVNKMAVGLRLDPRIVKEFKTKAKSRGLKFNPAVEQAMEKW
jgi:hypothetical protein